MARIASPRFLTFPAAVARPIGWVRGLLPMLLVAGCASWHRSLPVPPEVTPAGVAARVQVPPDLNVNPVETVVKPGETSLAPLPVVGASAVGLMGSPLGQGPLLTGAVLIRGRGESSPRSSSEPEPAIFTLADAIAFGRRNSPRLRSARAGIERARGQEQVAFSPFLPQIDVLGQYGGVSATYAPGIPGSEGFILAGNFGTRSYAETEVALQWTLYDFGRTGGRFRQAVAQERIAELQLVRDDQTVEFDVAVAYLDVLLARASRRVQEDAIRRAEATLDDTVARKNAGVALREDVLRAQVQLSESREALVLAREREFNSAARLNNAMGRNAGWPLEVTDLEVQPPMPGALADLLEQAAAQRPEVGVARQAVAAAQESRQAARAEFLPRVYVRASAGHTDGENVITGWQEGAGLHVEAPLYSGGRHRGELRSAEADIDAAVAGAQTILDAISLQVNLAYRGVVSARELIDLSRTAVVQAAENLRLVRVRYRNGNATPTDIVDSEAALTRSQQRFFSATYSYLAALARLDYAVGQQQGAFLGKVADCQKGQESAPEELPAPRKGPDIH
jgi:outer membrane protein